MQQKSIHRLSYYGVLPSSRVKSLEQGFPSFWMMLVFFNVFLMQSLYLNSGLCVGLFPSANLPYRNYPRDFSSFILTPPSQPALKCQSLSTGRLTAFEVINVTPICQRIHNTGWMHCNRYRSRHSMCIC